MKREAGETGFVEMAAEPEHSIYYGGHAASEIVQHLREGDVPQKMNADVVLKRHMITGENDDRVIPSALIPHE